MPLRPNLVLRPVHGVLALLALATLRCGGDAPAPGFASEATLGTSSALTVGWQFVGPTGAKQPDGSKWTGSTVDVEAIPNSSTVRVAALGSGILESQNGGDWTPLTDNLVPVNSPPTAAEGLAANTLATHPSDPTTLVFGTATENQHQGHHKGLSVASGIWRGVNVGIGRVPTWTQVASPSDVGEVLKIRWSTDQIVRAATSTGYWESGNGGVTWSRTLSGSFSDLAVAKAVGPWGVTYLAQDGVGLVARWTQPFRTPLQVTLIPNNAGRAGVAAVGTQGGPVYYRPSFSGDTGVQGLWRVTNGNTVTQFPNCTAAQVSAGPPWRGCFPNTTFGVATGWAAGLSVNPNNPNQLMASNAPAGPLPCVIQSQDGGVTWDVVGGTIHADIHTIAWDASGNAMAVGDGGFFYSIDGGRNWRGDRNTARMTSLTDFSVGADLLSFWGTAWDTGGFFGDGSGGWVGELTGDQRYVTADPWVDGFAYMSDAFGYRKRVDSWRRNCFGSPPHCVGPFVAIWVPTGPEPDGLNPSQQPARIAHDGGSPGSLYTASGSTIFTSDDRGINWRSYDGAPETIQDIAVGRVSCSGFCSSYVYALGVSNALYAESFGGQDFAFANITPSAGTVTNVIAHPTINTAPMQSRSTPPGFGGPRTQGVAR